MLLFPLFVVDLQLEEWAGRAGAQMSKSTAKSPAAVMFDAIDAATAAGTDVLIADTSGRALSLSPPPGTDVLSAATSHLSLALSYITSCL